LRGWVVSLLVFGFCSSVLLMGLRVDFGFRVSYLSTLIVRPFVSPGQVILVILLALFVSSC
jgi:hypothetical protein